MTVVESAAAVARLADAVDRLRGFAWTKAGPVGEPAAGAAESIAAVIVRIEELAEVEALPPAQLAATRDDFLRWAANPMASPRFDETTNAFRAPDPGEAFAFFGPLRTPNSEHPAHWRFEVVAGRRVSKALEDRAWQAVGSDVDRTVQLADLMVATQGFRRGNCTVLFPENVLKREPSQRQHFALTFPNKFPGIARSVMTDLRPKIMGTQPLLLESCDDTELYRIRCYAAVLHEHHHNATALPLATNVRLKNSTFAAILDEARVDCLAAQHAVRLCEADGPRIAEALLVDRALRAPFQPDWFRNPDSGAGLLLLEALHRDRHLRSTADWFGPWLDTAGEIGAWIQDLERSAADAASWPDVARDAVGRFLPIDDDGTFGRPGCIDALGLSDYRQPVIDLELEGEVFT